MAFASLIKYYATSTTDAIDNIKDIMVSAGWTLHDDLSGATPYGYVLSSTGESGEEWPMYLYIYKGTNTIITTNYVYWNNSTHTGNIKIASTLYSTIASRDSASFYIWCAATKDCVAYNSYVSQCQAAWAGIIDPITTTPANGTTQSGVSSGSDVVLTLDTGEADRFVVGTSYQIFDEVSVDWVEVSAVNTSTDQITISSLSYNFAAGARIGMLPYRWAVWAVRYNYAWVMRRDKVGTADYGNYDQIPMQGDVVSRTNVDPDERSQNYPMWPVIFYEYNNTGVAGYLPLNQYSVWLRAHINTNPELPMSVNNLDVGTSSGSNTASTFNDTTKTWVTNAYANKVLIITGGVGEGQFRKISSNTTTALTVSIDFTTIPTGTSEYTICDEGWQYLYVASSYNYSGAMRVL